MVEAPDRKMGLFMDHELIYELLSIISNKICRMHFFFWQYILDSIRDNPLKSLGECTAPSWLIEIICYCCFCLNELFLVLQETKYVFKGPWYSWCCVFVLYCIGLRFNVFFANARHSVYLVWCIRPKCPQQSFIAKDYWKCLQTVMCKSILPFMFMKICAKLKHIDLESYVKVEKLTSKVNVALW